MLSSSYMHVVFAGMLIIIQSVCTKRCTEFFERALKKQLVTGEYSSGPPLSAQVRPHLHKLHNKINEYCSVFNPSSAHCQVQCVICTSFT